MGRHSPGRVGPGGGSEAALRCRDLRVTYGDVVALAGVGLDLPPGRIHAIVGQNGAGKTTFARVAAGLVRPAAGSLSIHGRELRFGRVAAARAAGVELVHQSFALPPSFTVAEALEFGIDGRLGFFTRRRLLERWREHLRAVGVEVDPGRRIRDLPIESRQGVEIARALVTDAKVLILDEPTAVLPPPGIDLLFRRIRRLRERGVTVILILHKIREVFAIADTISVLRAGGLVAGPMARERTDAEAIGEMIVGAEGADVAPIPVARAPGPDRSRPPGAETAARGDESPPARRPGVPSPAANGRVVADECRRDARDSLRPSPRHPARRASAGERAKEISASERSRAGPDRGPVRDSGKRAAALRMAGASTAPDAEGAPLRALSLEVELGEIVGVAGVEGNGQRTLVRAIAGLAEVTAGAIFLAGTPATASRPARRRALGLRIIPFDRDIEGLSLTSALWENWVAGALLQRPLLAPIHPSRLRSRCDRTLKSWGVHFASPSQPAGSLSGGNAQKLILAREIDDTARLVVAAQPTRGLDLGATAFVWQSLRAARARGVGIVLISSDLDELFDVADRVVVMLSGRIVAEHVPPYDRAAVGRTMTGLAAGERR